MLKSLPSQISAITAAVGPRTNTRNTRFLVVFSSFLVALIVIFTVLFHVIMQYEGQSHSWLSGLYWVMVTMSTLGFGDITFHSDMGRLFSVVVLFSGVIFLLVLLPFTFIEFFYSPFVKAQQEARAPKQVPPSLRNHVILTNYDPVSIAFIRQIDKHGRPYVLVVKKVEEGLALHDAGVHVVVADLDDPASFSRCGFDRAVMIAATGSDFANTSIAFTARELSKTAVIAATADRRDSVDVLTLAGSSYVMQLGEQLGAAFARRTIATDAQSHLIGQVDELRIAEAMVAGTPLLGKTIAETRIRELTGVTIIGVWQRGVLLDPHPSVKLEGDSMLVLAGTQEQMSVYDSFLCIYRRAGAPCVIIGAGRVGRATARNLAELDVKCRIIDKDPSRVLASEECIQGSAAEYAVLEKAGILHAPAVIITTRDDDTNIYLTIYCRKLRPDIQIIVRANGEANVPRLHRAGADVVMSYASMGANILYNLMQQKEDTLLVAEGLNIFRIPAPERTIGKPIRETDIRRLSGCSIIAVRRKGTLLANPQPDFVLDAGDELVLIGTIAAEERFLEKFRS